MTISRRAFAASVGIAALVGAGAHGLLARPPAAPRMPTATAGPTTNMNGLPTGFARSAAGAVAAAATYVRQGQRLFALSSDERPLALRDMASRGATDAYVAEESRRLAELDGIAARGRGPLTWDVAVLATRVDAYARDRARVGLWRVGVLSIDGLASPLSEWTTVTYDLVWERGDWRIWSETQAVGPTPRGHPDEPPSTPEQLQTTLAGFERFPDGAPL